MKIKKGINVPVFSYKGNKNTKVQVGYTNGDTYYSKRTPRHFFRIFEGYGMSIDVYNELISREIDIICLYYNQILYESHLSQWKHSSSWNNVILITQQIDPQYILELSKMTTTNYNNMNGGDKMEEENQADLDNLGPVEGVSVDLTKYDKQETSIEKAEALQMPSTFTPLIEGTQQHYMQWVLKISSVSLESIREGEDKIDFRATELFNLVQDNVGNLKGFPTGDSAKLVKFLKDLKIDITTLKTIGEIKEAVAGKKVLIRAETKEREGKTNTYLRFRY